MSFSLSTKSSSATRPYLSTLAFVVLIISSIFGGTAYGSEAVEPSPMGKVPMLLPTTLKLSTIDYRSWALPNKPFSSLAPSNLNTFTACPPSFNCMEEWSGGVFFKDMSFVEYVIDSWNALPLDYVAIRQNTYNRVKMPTGIRLLRSVIPVGEADKLINLLNNLAMANCLPHAVDAVHVLIRDRQDLEVCIRSTNADILRRIVSLTETTWSWDARTEWMDVVSERAQWLQLKNSRPQVPVLPVLLDPRIFGPTPNEAPKSPFSPSDNELGLERQSTDSYDMHSKRRPRTVSFLLDIGSSTDSIDSRETLKSSSTSKCSVVPNSSSASKCSGVPKSSSASRQRPSAQPQRSSIMASHELAERKAFVPSPSNDEALYTVVDLFSEMSKIIRIDHPTKEQAARLDAIQDLLAGKFEPVAHELMKYWTKAETLPPRELLWDKGEEKDNASLTTKSKISVSPNSVLELSRNISDENTAGFVNPNLLRARSANPQLNSTKK
jgi:hypothetical protein